VPCSKPFISLASNLRVSKAALKAREREREKEKKKTGHSVDETISNLALKELNKITCT